MRGLRHRVLGGAVAGLLITALPDAGLSRAAPQPAIVLTGTVFPGGLGLGVAADPLGLQQALWAPLIAFDNQVRPVADLAARVPTLADGDVRITGGGMQVTVHVRAGLRFSDGSPLTSRDVAFGLRVNLDPALGNSFGLDEIAHISTPDARTVVLQFGDMYGAYLAYAMPPALPQRYLERKYGTTDIHQIALDYARDPYDSPRDVFSGPYRIAGVAPGQRLTLQPNPYFTALPTGQPRPEIRYTVISADQTALARDLHARGLDVDLALGFGPAILPDLQGLSAVGLRVRTLPSLAVEHLELNMAIPALRDLRVRQALQTAIDKRAFTRALFPASMHPDQLVATSLIPPASPYHDAALSISAYNPALARRLLRSAGYATTPNGSGPHLTLSLVAPDDPTRRRETDLLARAWAAVGVRTIVRLVSASPADEGGFSAPYARGGVLATRHFDVALFDLRLGPDPATVASLFDPDRVPTPINRGALRRNYTGIDDERLASLPETAQASLNVQSRKLGYNRLQVTVNQLLPYIVLYDRPQIVVDDGAIEHFAPAPQDGGALWNTWAWTRRSP